MSHQKRGKKIPSLEDLSASDLMEMRSSKLEQRDTRQRARELKRLDGLIKAVEVQAERRDRNAHVAINRLPPEVLREIFLTTCIVKLARYRSSDYPWLGISTVWNPTWIEKGRAISLMLVCYHWKEIALGIWELWNGVETYWQHKDDILLERSGRGPLKVLASRKLEPSYAVAHALQHVEHSSRIQELYCVWALTREDLQMPAPLLRSLVLQYCPSHMSDGSLELFDNHTPCLERLSLSSLCWLPSNAFTNLTFLALDTCRVSKLCAKTRSLLAGTPNLVDLILKNMDDSDYEEYGGAETDPADMKPVSLARLHRLLIDYMWVDDIDYVFRDARLNEDVSISIKAMRSHDDEHQILELVTTWPLNAVKQAKELHFQPHVAIVAGASSGLRFEADKGAALEDCTTFDGLWMLPLSSISHLCMFEWDACRVPSLECVRNLLRQMTALETLSINIEVLKKIVDALTLFRDPIDSPLCPALTTLRIVIRKDSDCDIILDSILPHRAQLAIKHLYIGLIDPQSKRWIPRQAVKDQLHGDFESVNFEMLLYDKAYKITLPLVCSEEAHRLWPPWLKVLCGIWMRDSDVDCSETKRTLMSIHLRSSHTSYAGNGIKNQVEALKSHNAPDSMSE